MAILHELEGFFGSGCSCLCGETGMSVDEYNQHIDTNTANAVRNVKEQVENVIAEMQYIAQNSEGENEDYDKGYSEAIQAFQALTEEALKK